MKEITFNDFYQLYQNEQLSLVDVREVEGVRGASFRERTQPTT